MKFLHTSDWHLGMTYSGEKSYKEDQKYAIGQILEIAVKEKVDGILLAGDVFDKSIASKEALQMYDELMTYICRDLKIPIYLIAGNHDGAERISQCNELLKDSGLYIAGSLQRKPQVVNKEDVDIYLLPWISTDKVKTIYPDKADDISTMEDAYQVVLDDYRSQFVEGHKNIIVAHAYIVNATTSTSDRAAEIGQATMVSEKVFEGFDYVALGHLHGPQDVGKNIRYSGTPMAYSFGVEEDQTKSVTIFDTDNMKQREIPIKQLRERNTLVGTYDELMKADYDKKILDGYVRLVVTDSYIGRDSMAAFSERYKNILEYSGKDLENGNNKITMTIEEFEDSNQTPEVVFSSYCKDILGEEPSEHLVALFKAAVEQVEKGE